MLIWTGVSCDGGETRLVVISYIEAGVVRGPLSRLCHYSVTGQTRDTVEGPTGHHWLPLCPTLTLSILISLSHAKIKALAGLAGDWGCVWCAARDGERHSGNLLRSRGHVLVTQSQVTHSQVTLKWLSSDSQVTLGAAVKRVTGHFLLVPSVWPVGPLRPQSNKIVVGNTSNLQTCSHWLLLGVRIIEGNSSDLINNSCYLFISFRMIKYRGDGGLAQRMSWLKMWRGRRERRGRTVRLLIVCSTLLTLVISTQGIRCYTDLEATQVSTGNRN